MVARQAIGTLSVVLPDGWLADDVIDRTQFGTFAALDACFLVNPEMPVGNQMLVIVTANNVGVGKGDGTFHQFFDMACAVDYQLTDVGHALLGGSNLARFRLLAVKMEKGEADVRLWHDDGKGCIQRQTSQSQFLAQDAHGMSHVVATGGQRIDIVYVLKHGATQEVAYDMGRLPSMSGEADAQSLIVFQCIVKFFLA